MRVEIAAKRGKLSIRLAIYECIVFFKAIISVWCSSSIYNGLILSCSYFTPF